MNCKQVAKRIPAFLQDELQMRELEAFLEHVEKCPECREELTIQFLVTEGLARLERGEDFDIERDMEMKIQMAKQTIRWRKYMEALSLAMGAVLMCIVTLILIWLVL